MKKVVRGYNRQFWRSVAVTLAATYGAVLVLAVPTYAADGISLTVDMKDVELKYDSTSDLYEATTKVTVDPAPLSGFDLTIHAKDADLVNTSDSRYRIKGMDKEEILMGMNAKSNLWGYRLKESHGAKFVPNGFMHVPAGDEAPSVIVDTASEYDNAGCKGKKQCEVHMTFGASLDSTNLPAGKYSTEVTYTATAKLTPKPKSDGWRQRTAQTTPSETCEAGNTNSSCLVDLDKNMIPVKYTGSATNAQWTSVADPEAVNSGWYDYANKQWANAITVKPEALSKYRGFSKVVDQADILGFWVYIPRYRYKMLHFYDDPEEPQNFTIEFENKRSTKAVPINDGDWATHPAFIFGTKEFNGIWFAKFETTGGVNSPTVLPNSLHLSGNYDGIKGIGSFYSVAKSLGVNDPQNVGGKSVSSPQNSHHLAKFSSHMVNSNDWGAAAYLSASKYGAGYKGIQINSQAQSRGDSWSVTGCGPQASGNISTYKDGGALDTQQACSKSNLQHAYNGSLGQLASTTNNPTGIYDMSGGAYEYTAASYTTDLNESGVSDEYGDLFGAKAHPPYVNTYNLGAPTGCDFKVCGGQALYETSGWNDQRTDTLGSTYVWLGRGGDASSESEAGVFALYPSTGITESINGVYAFRVALAPTTQD